MANPRGNPNTLTHYRPKWASGATHVIRVPIALSPQILDYAHQLDSNTRTQAQVLNCELLLQVIEDLEYVLDTPRNNFSKEKKSRLQSAIDNLKTLVTCD